MKILSSFIHPHVVPNPYDFISLVKHKRPYFVECAGLALQKNLHLRDWSLDASKRMQNTIKYCGSVYVQYVLWMN